jgi:hypothetical protein
MRAKQLKSGYFQVRLGIGELVIEKNLSETTLPNQYLIQFSDDEVFTSLDPLFQAACFARQMSVRKVLDKKRKF